MILDLATPYGSHSEKEMIIGKAFLKYPEKTMFTIIMGQTIVLKTLVKSL